MLRLYADIISLYIRDLKPSMDFGIHRDPGTNLPWMLRDDSTSKCVLFFREANWELYMFVLLETPQFKSLQDKRRQGFPSRGENSETHLMFKEHQGQHMQNEVGEIGERGRQSGRDNSVPDWA